MLPTGINPISDDQRVRLLQAGRKLGRERHQHGWVEPVGKTAKKWKGHFYVYVLEAGGKERRAHRSVTLGLRSQMTKGQAETKLRTIIDAATQQQSSPGQHTVRWFWENRFRPMREPSWKESARRELVANIERYVLAAFGGFQLAEVDRFQVQMHINTLAEKYSQSVVEKARIWTRAILQEAFEQGFIPQNPAKRLTVPQTKKVCKRTLTVEEIGRLLKELAPRDQLAVRACLILGLRPGEVFALRWDDIEAGTLRVDEGMVDGQLWEPKTAASAAAVTLPTALARELGVLKEAATPTSDREFIFPNSTGGVQRLDNFRHRALGPAAERAGVDGVTFQAMRRTCATMLAAHGTVKDVQAHLRHAQASTTLGVYVQAVPESVRKAVNALGAVLFPDGTEGELDGGL